MNFRLVSKSLGLIALLIGAMMVFSLPWAHPALGHRTDGPRADGFESRGFMALLGSIVVCTLSGAALLRGGRHSKGHMYRREAMAVVGLSWILATVLGALPFYFSGTLRCPSVRLFEEDQPALVYAFGRLNLRDQWLVAELSPAQHRIMKLLLAAGAAGLDDKQLQAKFVENAPEKLTQFDAAEQIRSLAAESSHWKRALILPNGTDEEGRQDNFRVRWVPMGVADALFESQSGFSTTGATVLYDLEDPSLVPHCILFWRSSTHFLGGLGIIVLFVTILGQGSAGKALMRAEMPGPTKEAATARMQHTAWLFAAIYVALNVVLTITLLLVPPQLTIFDALCHAFGTMATGGFSTYNASVGHFDSAAIEYVIIVFMILAGTNFTLLYFLLVRQPGKLLADIEWRAYVGIIIVVTAMVVCIGLMWGDFPGPGRALRAGLFQVVSITTTTGFGTDNFDNWNGFGRGILLLLMFIGGCAGSTGGGMKVIRHILFLKIMKLEIELAYHPTVVRPLRLRGRPVDDPGLRKNILVYFGLILVIFIASWMFLMTLEPDTSWGPSDQHADDKLIDVASATAATLNNIGPGLGIVGATNNYTNLSPISKFLFVWLMMIGRLEIFSILVLFTVGFWKAR